MSDEGLPWNSPIGRLRNAADYLDTAKARRCDCPDCQRDLAQSGMLRQVADDHEGGCLRCTVGRSCPDWAEAHDVAERVLGPAW